jgi:hypothetical protein
MAKTIFSVLFWIWGGAGFFLCTANYMSLSGSVGVGTSTYMALGFLYWLCGMVLFGLAALIVQDGPPTNLVGDNFPPAADTSLPTTGAVPPGEKQ